MLDENELEVDDIIGAAAKRKKRINCGSKGKRTERGLVNDLNARFSKLLSEHSEWGMFSRSIGSGNRWGQKVVLSQAAKDTFSGDISVPTQFRFVLESKGGYNEIDLVSAFCGGSTMLDSFLKQVSDDSKRSGRLPMLLWKKDRKPRIAFLKTGTIPDETKYTYRMYYRDWTAFLFDDIIQLDDSFFFDMTAINKA